MNHNTVSQLYSEERRFPLQLASFHYVQACPVPEKLQSATEKATTFSPCYPDSVCVSHLWAAGIADLAQG